VKTYRERKISSRKERKIGVGGKSKRSRKKSIHKERKLWKWRSKKN
jgi:hypothetical protein